MDQIIYIPLEPGLLPNWDQIISCKSAISNQFNKMEETIHSSPSFKLL